MRHSRYRGRLWGAISVVAISSLAFATMVGTASATTSHKQTVHKKKAKAPKVPNPKTTSGTITVYAALTTAGGQGFVNDFEAAYPHVTVNMVTGGTGSLEPELLAQNKSGDLQADVVLFADPSSMGQLNDAKPRILSNFKPSLKGRTVPKGYSGNGWVGAFSFQNVIIYNSSLATPPTTWLSLTTSAFKNEVAIGSASYSGTTFGWAAALANKYGWNYFNALKANNPRIENSTTTTGTDVATGRDEAAVTLDSVARSLLASGANIKIDWPSDGSVICPAPIGVTTAGMSQEKQASEAFVDWMLSRKGQVAAASLYYDAAYFRAKPIDPIPANAPIIYPNWNKIGKQKNTVLNKFGAIFG